MREQCEHLENIEPVEPEGDACASCVALEDSWVHLRACLVCGHVGCCDSSVNRHARKHFEETGHPLIASAEPGESWRWCYIDQTYLRGE